MTNHHDDPTDDAPLPEDPDWQDVPPALRDLDGRTWHWIDQDGELTTGTVVIVPELFGHARRLRDGTYDDDTDDDGGTPA